MNRKEITFTTQGGDYNFWALDQMLQYVKNGIEKKTQWKYVESIQFADIVIFGWYSGFKENKFLINKNQVIICLLENDTEKVYYDLFQKRFINRIDMWLTQSTKEKRVLNKKGFKAFVMPYTKESKNISSKELSKHKDYLKPIRNHKLISGKKLLVSIQRDSSFINNKWVPKEQKNPKYLVNLYRELLKQNISIMLVIAGVRRHWIINELDKLKLPYIYIGQKPHIKDDYLQKLPRETILEITKECDFAIVTSSWEGGPLCIIESLEVEKLTFSTNVGFSKDLLPRDLILEGNLNIDTQNIKKVINSNSKISQLINKSLEKYQKFKTFDLDNIIEEIHLLLKVRTYSLLKYKFLNKISLIDKLISLLENFARRLLCFIKRNLNYFKKY